MVSNFEFLEKDFPVLANFGELAEKYCYSDSNSCLMKLGMIGETIVNLMFTYDRIALPQDNTAVARIDTLVREGLLTRDLATILHGLRKVRNKAVHENYSSVTDSKNFLLMAYGMCEWFMQTYGDWSYTHKDFVMPEENVMIVSVDKEAEEKKEAELAKQAEENAANAPKVARDERKKQANKVANQRPKTEAETRFLIDEQLRMVGWEADTENIRYSKGVRPTKGRKLAIAEYPTNSTVGNRGYADYALFIGEKLVGIIEAKAIHKDIPSVIDYQGKDYPRCIREEDEKYVIGKWGEFKVPFTFATNGRPYLEQYRTKSGIWFLDLRKPDNSPMALHGWMSPDGMEELLAADVDSRNKELKEMPYDLLTDKDGLNLRPNDMVVLVEDDLAKLIIEKIMVSKNIARSIRIKILPTGGWTNTITMAYDVTSSNLLHRGTKLAVVLDRDIKGSVPEFISNHKQYSGIKIDFLPIASLEKYLKSHLVDKVDNQLFVMLDTYLFQKRPLNEIIREYVRTNTKDDSDGKAFYGFLLNEIKSMRKDREDIVDIVVRYILENEEEKINELSSYLVKKIDE